MARMNPAVIDPQDNPPGELAVFHELRTATPESWFALHSFDLPRHEAKAQGEADFVVIVPGLAVICLEVKSHERVRRDEAGMWHLGGDPPTEKSPFKQASTAMWSIHHRIKERPDLAQVPCLSIVVFPRCEFTAEPIEWEPWQVIDERRLETHGLRAALEHAARQYRKKLKDTPNARWFRDDDGQPTERQCQQIRDKLRPYFECARGPKRKKQDRDAELKRFTEEQFRVLDMLEDDHSRLIFRGGAGTGKTFLAIEAAQRAALGGERVLLCCYNNLLAAWLKIQVHEYAPDITASTLHALMTDEVGPPPNSAGPDFWRYELPQRMLDALATNPRFEPFDRLIIDEAQDLAEPEYLLVFDLLVKGGLRHGKVTAFGDFEFQRIFGEGPRNGSSTDALQALRTELDGCVVSKLKVNCRNRPRVGIVAIAAIQESVYTEYRRADDDVEVTYSLYDTAADQTKQLEAAISAIRADHFELGDIVILSHHQFDSSAAHRLSQPYSGWLGAPTATTRGKIRAFTVHAFKGLESPVVILTDVDAVTTERDRQLLYIGSTRATERLVVLVDLAAQDNLRELIIEGPHGPTR